MERYNTREHIRESSPVTNLVFSMVCEKFDNKIYLECPFLAVDYYGTQDSKGNMNLQTMKKSATELYDWAQEEYPQSEIVIMGHSYGAGMATYLASVRKCKTLVLAAGYRDISDLYNKMIPIFRGPLKVFISNNIKTSEYAKSVTSPVYIIGSKADRTLGESLQEKLSDCFENSELKIFKCGR